MTEMPMRSAVANSKTARPLSARGKMPVTTSTAAYPRAFLVSHSHARHERLRAGTSADPSAFATHGEAPTTPIVARALEIISNEAHWTRASIARTADGLPCACLDPLAYKFCAVGALYRAAVSLSVGTGSNKFSRPRNMCSGRTTANMPVCRTSTMSKAAKPSSRCSRRRSLDNRRGSMDCANPWVWRLYRGRPTLRSVRTPTARGADGRSGQPSPRCHSWRRAPEHSPFPCVWRVVQCSPLMPSTPRH